MDPRVPYQELVPLSAPAGCLMDPRVPYQELVPLSAPAGCLMEPLFPVPRVGAPICTSWMSSGPSYPILTVISERIPQLLCDSMIKALV